MKSEVILAFPLTTQRLPSREHQLIASLMVTGLRTRLSRAVKPKSGKVVQGSVFANTGFVTDYSPIPEKLHGFVGRSRVDVAGVVHDFLYPNTNCPRIEADALCRSVPGAGGLSRAARVRGMAQSLPARAQHHECHLSRVLGARHHKLVLGSGGSVPLGCDGPVRASGHRRSRRDMPTVQAIAQIGPRR